MAVGKQTKRVRTPMKSGIRSLADLFDEKGSPRFERANTSFEEIIYPYYGSKEKLKEEVKKAEEYAEKRKLAKKEDYEKIFQPLPVTFEAPMSAYSDSTLDEDKEGNPLEYPEAWVISEKENKKELEKLKAYKEGRLPIKEKEDFESEIEQNDMTPESYERWINPERRFKSALEHEAGHDYSKPISENAKYVADKATYFTKPSEMANVVGLIQREKFALTGKRFEDEKELKQYVETTPLEEAIKGYSPEAERGWRMLYKNKKSGGALRPSVLDAASKLAPALVLKKSKDKKVVG